MAADEKRKIVSMEKARAEKVVAFNRAKYGKVIRANRQKQGLSQPQLAAILQTSKNYVSNWELGKARPDMNIIPQLCEALGICISEFFGVHSDLDQLTTEQRLHIRRYVQLNTRDQAVVEALTDSLLRMEEADFRQHCQDAFLYLFHNNNVAAAGTLNMLGDDVDGEYEFLRRDEDTDRADEIITVTGDSMEPTFHDGDDLLIEHCETLEYGEIGIFIINGEGFVKEYREGGVYSHNAEAYPFRKFHPGDDVRIVGRVLGRVTGELRPTEEEAVTLEELRLEGAF